MLARPDVRRRLIRLAVALVALVIVLGVGTVIVLVVTLSGGLDDVWPRSRPTERSPQVVQARTAAEPAVAAELTALVDGPVRSALGPSLRPTSTGPPATTDECERGQHNWKIDDPYDLRCTMRATVMVVAGNVGFREQMLRLHDALVAAGWRQTPEDSGIPEAVTDYWDAFAGPFPNSPTMDDVYSQADLPSRRYLRVDDATTQLEVDWTDRSDRHQPEAASVGEGDYGLLLTVRRQYFEK